MNIEEKVKNNIPDSWRSHFYFTIEFSEIPKSVITESGSDIVDRIFANRLNSIKEVDLEALLYY